jgi:hypothetical protein
MARWRGTTTERGYGGSHVAERKRRVASFQPGDPCAECGQPMEAPAELLDVPHDHVNGGYKPGLAHASCNRADGASRSNQTQPRMILAVGGDVICATCSKPYHYAARSCEICGAHYHPNHGRQRSCSRACGAAVYRRDRIASGWIPPELRPTPVKVPRKPREPREPKNGWPRTPLRFYDCRICGDLKVQSARKGAVPGHGMREVCPARSCQVARLTANNLINRSGFTQEEAVAEVRRRLANGYVPGAGRWAEKKSDDHAYSGFRGEQLAMI